jgi:hypothetical protein
VRNLAFHAPQNSENKTLLTLTLFNQFLSTIYHSKAVIAKHSKAVIAVHSMNFKAQKLNHKLQL